MNWEQMEKEAGMENQKTFKEYAPNGEHKVKLESAEVIDRENWKSPAIRFTWAEDDQYKYPKSVNHWLSITNPSWRAVHQRNILMALGIEQKKAQELVEAAEKDKDRIKLVRGYEALYKRVAERKPETTIVVQDQWRDGKPVVSDKGTAYSESDFKSGSCRMMEGHEDKPSTAESSNNDDFGLDSIPF